MSRLALLLRGTVRCISVVPRRSFSASARLKVDPSQLVHGLTKERVDSDPQLADYLQANYPDAFEQQKEGEDEDSELAAALEDEDDDDKDTKREQIVYPRNIRPLTTYRRDPVREDGTRNSKRLRYHDNMIPGLVYGGDPGLGIYSHQPESKIFVKTPWPLLERELDSYHLSFESRVFNLTLLEGLDDDTGTMHRVTPQNVQRHPVMSTIYCANFVRYHPGRPLKLPIRYVNEEESLALKRDAFILPIQRFVECFVEDGADIPQALDLECTGLEMRNVIRRDRLVLPDGVRYSDRVLKRGQDFVIGVVYGGGRGDDSETTSDDKK